MINVGTEVQRRIVGADGATLWSGAQVVANDFMVQVVAGGTTIKMGDAVQWDANNSVIPRPETTASAASALADLPMSLALYGKISPASINAVNLIGVAQDPIAAGKRGVVAGSGSLVCVACTATLLALGAFVGSSATAGAVALQAVGGTNCVLGAVFKINSATVGTPDWGTGSQTWVGILIKGGSASVS